MSEHRSERDRDALPTGLMVALAQNMHAMKEYAALDEQGRARLIARATAAKSQEEMQHLVRHLSEFL